MPSVTKCGSIHELLHYASVNFNTRTSWVVILVQIGMDVNSKCRDSSTRGSGNMFTSDEGESYLNICSD